MSEVELLSSEAIGWLVQVRKKLVQRGRLFHPPCRRRTLFAIFRDESEALEAIRQGESDRLLLCGVCQNVREAFTVCSLHLAEQTNPADVREGSAQDGSSTAARG